MRAEKFTRCLSSQFSLFQRRRLGFFAFFFIFNENYRQTNWDCRLLRRQRSWRIFHFTVTTPADVESLRFMSDHERRGWGRINASKPLSSNRNRSFSDTLCTRREAGKLNIYFILEFSDRKVIDEETHHTILLKCNTNSVWQPCNICDKTLQNYSQR
jgi:hypothetical protein